LSIQATGGAGPYSAEDVDAFIVALPEKVFYPADAVEHLAPTLFKFKPIISGLPTPESTIIRYFITTGSAYRRFMREHESACDPRLLQAIMALPFAQFVWVIEFATVAEWQVGQISARAIVDATASVREVHSLWLLYDRKRALLFGRQTMGDAATGMGILDLSGMDGTAFPRMDQNLRPTQTK
jgi:hypothetical protein